MNFVKLTAIIALSLGLTACGSSDEDVVAGYIAETEPKYADEASCIAEALTASVGTDKMKEWAKDIEHDGKIGTLDITFMRNLSSAAKKCL